jgi:hypothetical protein
MQAIPWSIAPCHEFVATKARRHKEIPLRNFVDSLCETACIQYNIHFN